MPVLKNNRTTKKIILPVKEGEEEAWVEVYEDLLVGDIVDIPAMEQGNMKAGVEVLQKTISDWNFTLENGEKAPITFENIRLLRLEQLVAIQEQLVDMFNRSALNDAKKKPSTSTSPQKTTTGK